MSMDRLKRKGDLPRLKAVAIRMPLSSKIVIPVERCESMSRDIDAYNAAQDPLWRTICERLAGHIDEHFPDAGSQIWHGGPVWFLEGNPIVGYWVRKRSVQLLFWSGQSFEETGLRPEGKFKAAHAQFAMESDIDPALLSRWLQKARLIQWDYKNIVKRKGVLEPLKGC